MHNFPCLALIALPQEVPSTRTACGSVSKAYRFVTCIVFFFLSRFYCITNIINISQVVCEKIMSHANDSHIFSLLFTLVSEARGGV